MFRTSLRSIADPIRDHVCFACLAQRFGAPRRLRAFTTSSPARNESSPKSLEDVTSQAIAAGFKSLGKVPPPSFQPHQNTDQDNLQSDEHDHGASDSASAVKSKSKKSARKPRQILPKKLLRRPHPRQRKTKAPESDESSDPKKAKTRATSDLPNPRSPSQKHVSRTDRENLNNVLYAMGSGGAKSWGHLRAKDLHLKPLDIETPPVPGLSFGLERVLFNPGVYHLRDPRSRVFNFDPYLGSIMPVTEFDFAALKDYITSSKDNTLRDIARKEKKKYMGSSSSMTSVLSHFHYLLSQWRGIDIRTISQGFPDKLRTFTRLLRAPSAMFLRYQDGVYAIDADKEFDTANILMNLGKSMEKLLTLPKEDFERYRRSSTNKISPEEEQAVPESYHYSTLGDFVMRSQLDAYDPRLPGTGMFDLKTRAVVSIRMDARNFEKGLGYEIKNQYGPYESYEREFYDMIRAAFLKYSLQVRIGRMDGIFVAFHNIERIFGFQYVSLPEMDLALHGQRDTFLGDAEFHLSLALWNKILDKATAKFPKRSLRLHFETRDAQTPFMYIFAEPVTEDEIQVIQTKNQAEIDAYQRRVLDLAQEESDKPIQVTKPSEPSETPQTPKPVDNQANPADETTTSEEKASEASNRSQQETPEAEAETEAEPPKELFAMTLLIKNKVNGKYVERPHEITERDHWKVEYEMNELQGEKALALYKACQKRRNKALAGRGEDETDVANSVYIRRLREIAQQGRKYRQDEDRLDQAHGVIVLGESSSPSS